MSHYSLPTLLTYWSGYAIQNSHVPTYEQHISSFSHRDKILSYAALLCPQTELHFLMQYPWQHVL